MSERVKKRNNRRTQNTHTVTSLTSQSCEIDMANAIFVTGKEVFVPPFFRSRYDYRGLIIKGYAVKCSTNPKASREQGFACTN